MAKDARKIETWSTGTGKLKYIDGGVGRVAQHALARTAHWLRALLRRLGDFLADIH